MSFSVGDYEYMANSNNGSIHSYSLIAASYPVEREYKGESVYCFCKMKAPRWFSWTEKNPGRRFYGCSKYTGQSSCGFYAWHDPRIGERARMLLNELKERGKWLFREASRANMVEADIREENMVLKEELKVMKKMLDRKSTSSRLIKPILLCFLILSIGYVMMVIGGVDSGTESVLGLP